MLAATIRKAALVNRYGTRTFSTESIMPFVEQVSQLGPVVMPAMGLAGFAWAYRIQSVVTKMDQNMGKIEKKLDAMNDNMEKRSKDSDDKMQNLIKTVAETMSLKIQSIDSSNAVKIEFVQKEIKLLDQKLDFALKVGKDSASPAPGSSSDKPRSASVKSAKD